MDTVCLPSMGMCWDESVASSHHYRHKREYCIFTFTFKATNIQKPKTMGNNFLNDVSHPAKILMLRQHPKI